MVTVKHRRDAQQPVRLTPSESARLDALDDAALAQAAESDPDNPPMSDAELTRAALARTAQRVRHRLGLSQKAFAARYRIGHGRLRDIEQGRGQRVDTALLAYLRVIDHDPQTVDHALEDT